MTDCTCPVHRSGQPPTLPLGVSLSPRLSIHQIDNRTAKRIYDAHHSYVHDHTRDGIIVHHGVYVDDWLIGAISYGPPLMRRLHGIDAGNIVEVARVCVAVDQPNAASCAMARSQDRFLANYQRKHGVQLLVSYVRGDYDGTMFKAIRDKGWSFDGVAEGHQAGNRPEREIRDYDKDRWIFPVDGELEQTTEQATLTTHA